MSAKIVIPSFLKSLTANRESVDVNVGSVIDSLKDLGKQFPEIEKTLFAKDGELNSYVGVYVNGKDACAEGVIEPVKDGDELQIVFIIGGG